MTPTTKALRELLRRLPGWSLEAMPAAGYALLRHRGGAGLRVPANPRGPHNVANVVARARRASARSDQALHQAPPLPPTTHDRNDAP